MAKDGDVRKLFTPRKPINRKTKLNLVFDEKARREFLTGFHKRKLQRRKKAKEELEQHLKEERKRLKQEARESYKKLVLSNRPIPEAEEACHAEQQELENHSVSILELSVADLAAKNNWIGINQVKYEENTSEVAENKETPEELPGMELNSAKDVKKVIKKQATKLVKNSKPFQQKHRLERQKNIKKSLKMKKERTKVRSKNKHRRKN